MRGTTVFKIHVVFISRQYQKVKLGITSVNWEYLDKARHLPMTASSSVCSLPMHSNLKLIRVFENALWAFDRAAKQEKDIIFWIHDALYYIMSGLNEGKMANVLYKCVFGQFSYNYVQSSLAITRPVITLIGCNAVGRASRFFGHYVFFFFFNLVYIF